MTVEERIQRQEKIVDRQLEWIRASDAKIPPMIVLNVAMAASVATVAPPFSQWTLEVFVTFILFAVFLLLSLVFLIYSAIPQIRSTKSVIYFRGILEMNQEVYKDAIKNLSAEWYFHDLIAQSYHNARIADSKYRVIQFAMLAGVGAIIPWFATFYLFLVS